MRSLLAVALSLSLFLSTFDAQTFAQTEAEARFSRAQVNLNGVWEILDKDENHGGGGGQKKTVRIALNAPWTDTGVRLVQGQPFSVAASGQMNWFTGGCPGSSANCTVTPDGRSWSICEKFASGFIAPNVNCWSLIGRIDDGPVFEVGSSLDNFRGKFSGELFLGVNDDAGGFADNTGQWNAEITLNAGVKRFLISQAARGFSMCVTEDEKSCLPHTTLAGSVESDPSRLRLVTTFTSKDPEVYLTVLDPDHLKGPRGIYMRSVAGAYDVPCDASNSAHVTGEFAVMRARDAMHHYKSDELTACWMRIAAESGDARSQAMMAYFAHQGEGIPKNLTEAEHWAQKSADQKDAFGEIMLGLMYENNEVAFNPLSGPEVIDRAYVEINRIRKLQGLPPIRQPNQQQTAQGPDPRAAGAAALGIMLMGALAGMGGSSPGSSNDGNWAAIERGQAIHRENEEGCANGDSGACNRAGESMPERQ